MDHALLLERNPMAKKGIPVSFETELIFPVKFWPADEI